MLLIALFSLFVVFGAVDLTPQRARQSPIDQSKELLLTSVVIFLFNFHLFSNKIVLSVLFVFSKELFVTCDYSFKSMQFVLCGDMLKSYQNIFNFERTMCYCLCFVMLRCMSLHPFSACNELIENVFFK